jgi:chromosome segregation ATPase
LAAAREALEKKLADLKESSDKKVADARKAAYEAAAKAEGARKDAEAVRKELADFQATTQRTGDEARELAQVRETLEAHVAELNARLEAEEERTGILSAQAAEARAQLESAAERGPAPDAEERLRAAEARAEDLARRAVGAEARMRELDAVAAQGDGAAVPLEADAALRTELEELKSHRALLEKELSDARSMADVAEAQVAEIAGELQAVRWEKDEIEQKLEKATRGGPPATGDAAKLQDQLAQAMAELALSRREVERLEAVVASLAVRTEFSPPGDGVADLQAQLAAAVQRAADAEAALGAARAGTAGDHAEALQKAVSDREAVAGQLAERDGKIARLQREVADKTERLGRLAKELGELKAKGLGKIFR